MATNIDKALYSNAPMMGLAELDTEPIEIEIENPESVSISGPGFEIEIEPGGEISGEVHVGPRRPAAAEAEPAYGTSSGS